MLSELVVPAAAWWWAAAARLLAALHALNELAWGRGDNPDTLIFSSLSTQANKQLATNITRPKRFGIHHVVRARCYNVIMLSKGAWFRAFLGNPPNLPLFCQAYMSSKHLLRVKEVPVEVSTKLKQHDISTCKVITIIGGGDYMPNSVWILRIIHVIIIFCLCRIFSVIPLWSWWTYWTTPTPSCSHWLVLCALNWHQNHKL